MSPIPGEPLKPTAPELTTSDGRKFKLKLPGLEPEPAAEERSAAEPAGEDPAPPGDPDRA